MKRSLQLFNKQSLAFQRMKNLLKDGYSSEEEVVAPKKEDPTTKKSANAPKMSVLNTIKDTNTTNSMSFPMVNGQRANLKSNIILDPKLSKVD